MDIHIGLHAERIALQLALPDLLPAGDEQHAARVAYRLRFASYIRSGETSCDRSSDVPEQWRIRVFAVNAFDAHGAMLGTELVEGRYLEAAIGRLLADPNAQYLKIHYANPGRYAARVERD